MTLITCLLFYFSRFLSLKIPKGRSFISEKQCAAVLIIIWLTVTGSFSLQAVWAELVYYPLYSMYYCTMGLTLNPQTLDIYIIVTRTINYAIPLACVWLAYIGIACTTASKVTITYRFLVVNELRLSVKMAEKTWQLNTLFV